jgi:RND family efflux transporter MFP subunit
MKTGNLFAAGLAALLLAGCSKPEAPAQPLRTVRVMKVDGAAASGSLTFPGEVRARYESRLGFRLGGKIVERRVDVGSRVRAGDPIARLDATDLALAAASAQAQITSLESERALAAAELERSRELRAKNYISQADLDRRASAFATVEARLEAARAQHRQAANQAAYATLHADTDGVITAVEAEAGQVVAAGQAVARLARVAPRRPARGELEVAFAVPESQRDLVERARGLTVTLNARPGKSWKGALRELAPAADPATRTYAARVAIIEPDADVELGMSARVEIGAAAPAERIEVPFAALYAKDEAAQVFVLQPDGTVQLRPVKTAGVAGERIVIESGLVPGDVVVAAGAQLLRPGQRVRVLAEPATASRTP